MERHLAVQVSTPARSSSHLPTPPHSSPHLPHLPHLPPSQDLLAGAEDRFNLVHGFDAATVEQHLMESFSAADGARSGLLPINSVHSCLEGCGLGLGPNEVFALMSVANPDEGGAVDYAGLAAYAFHVLQYMEQQAAYLEASRGHK